MATAVLVMSLMTAVSAQAPVTLTMNVGVGNRTLEVTDLAGGALTDLELIPGQPQAYRAAVNDLDYLIEETFTVTTENNNLYLVDPDTGVPDLGSFIASEHVSVAVGPDISVLGELIDLTPIYNVVTAPTTPECVTLLGAVGGLDLGATPVTDVCAALVGVEVPIIGEAIEGLDIDGLLDDLLALVPGSGGAQAFTVPSYADGTIGNGDPAPVAGPPTSQVIMTGTPLLALGTGLADDLLARLTALLPALPTDVAGVDASSVVGALNASGVPSLSALGDGIAGLAPDTTAQEGIINSLFDLTLGPIDLSIIDSVTGVYAAIPSVVANAPDGTAPGAYTGTHLITLMSE